MVALNPHAGAALKLVCFHLHGQQFAAPITHVKETLALRPITRVFLAPPWVAGILNLRGDIVAVADLALLLGMPRTEPTDDSRILIARHGGRSAGIVVDRLADVRTCDEADIQPPPPTLVSEGAALLRGLLTIEGGAPLRILDLPALFDPDRWRALARA